MQELVSVIMSTYNESLDMLDKSIKSILTQTYKNIQLIIINDNPSREEMSLYLDNMANEFSNILYLKNDSNLGLVRSLNKGIKAADGVYIARMDADDISEIQRIEKQLNFLKKNDCDIVGSSVITIDETDNRVGEIKVPITHDSISSFYKYGSCLLHPTWFGRKRVFLELSGYRNIYSCEDYDFIMRAIEREYHLGNVPEFLLNYRIRSAGISVSSEAQQKLTMYFIEKNKTKINELKENDFEVYLHSEQFYNNLDKINQYIEIKNIFKGNKHIGILDILRLIINKYFYINIWARIKRKQREKYSF